jgi:serine/threonine protein kinase
VNVDLIASIERLKQQNAECVGPKAEWKDCELARGNSIVMLTKDFEGRFTAVKTARGPGVNESFRREINILKTMNHPLVVQIRDDSSGANHKNPVVSTDFVANGSLADHLPDGNDSDLCQLSGSTRIMRIIAGIVLAMRCIHSRGIIHRSLTPDNILLDLDWNVKICNFGHSVSVDQLKHSAPADPNGLVFWPYVISRYAAPETYRGITVPESDVFSFGMILYELIIGRPVFPKNMNPYQMALAMVHDDWSPGIPYTVIPVTAELIQDCLAADYRNRPSFHDILERLEVIDFKLIAGVNSMKIAAFVAAFDEYEMRHEPYNHQISDG